MTTGPSPREKTSRAHFYAFLGALFAALGVFLWMIAPFILSLFLGGLLAVISQPVYDRFRSVNLGRSASALLSTGLILVLVLGPLGGFGFLAARQGLVVGRQLAELQEFSPKVLTRTFGRTSVARALGGPAEVSARLKAAIRSAGQIAAEAVLKTAASVPAFLLQLVLTLVAFFFFLIDGRRLVDFTLSRAAFEKPVQDKLRRTFTDMARSTVLAGFAAASTQAMLIWIAYVLVGVPGAFVAGGGTFLLSWVPLLGSFPASAAGAAYLYSQDAYGRMAVMIAFGIAAGVADNFVRPLVLKGRSDLHPLVGLIAIIAGIDMCGILGIFVGPLLAAVLISMLDIWPEIAARFGVDVTDGSA